GSIVGTVKVDAIATFRARAGIAYDNALIYVTAGPAWGHTKFSAVWTGGGTPTSWASDDWRFGLAAGAGIEWRVGGRWTLRGEWMHVELEQKDVQSVPASGRLGTAPSFDIARIGVNYFFAP